MLIEKLTEKIDNVDLINEGIVFLFILYILFGPYVISI
jgi:hypothetical protein